MYFPYLTAEVKEVGSSLEIADKQNMHSMSIALRAVVSLSQAAGCPETVHRRILGFSISHERRDLQLYGYYPDIVDNKTSYFRWPIARLDIWTEEGKWACYRFVENLDREFLPIHTDRLMKFLEKLPDPEELEFQKPSIPSRKRTLDTLSQDQDSESGLQMAIQTLAQQMKEQEEEQRKKEAEQQSREERLLAELKEQKEHFRALEERLFPKK